MNNFELYCRFVSISSANFAQFLCMDDSCISSYIKMTTYKLEPFVFEKYEV